MRKEDKGPCLHIHWEVRGENLIGCGHCKDCKKEVSLAILFDNLRLRMEEALRDFKIRGSS